MIRVLRVLEYEYDTAERFARDKANWTSEFNQGNGRMQSSIVSVTEVPSPARPQPGVDFDVVGERIEGSAV